MESKKPTTNAAPNVSPALHRPAAELLDHADVAALVAPGLGDDGRVERHPGQPGAVLAGLRVAEVVGADEPLGARVPARGGS